MRPLVCLGILAVSGCQLTSSRIIPSPLTYSEQENEILALVPLGTERDEAARKLSAAGIDGDFGTGRNIYYCDLWNRKNGERWHLNVALLFDKSGKLYKTQVAQADTGVLTSSATNSAAGQKSVTASPSGGTTGPFKVGREAAGSSRR